MPFLLMPVGAYLYGRFVDGDEGIPWTRIAIISLAVVASIYFVKRGK
jgi:hypothetical protein